MGRKFIRDLRNMSEIKKIRFTEGEHKGQVVRAEKKEKYQGSDDNPVGYVYIPTSRSFPMIRIPGRMVEEL